MNTNYSFGVKNIEKVPTSFKHNISFIATAGLWECGGNGYCLDRPDDPNKTCHCPYVPPKPKPAVCKQGQECGKPFSKRNTEICGNGECIWDCTSHPCVIMSNQKFVCFFMNFNSHANLKGFGLGSLSGACRGFIPPQ